MSIEDYKPRFSFEITEEQRARANRLIATYGLRRAIFGKLLNEVLDIIEEHGGVAIGILMSEDIKSKDVIPSMKKAEQYKREDPNG